jgi:hypothetical protein
MKNTPKDSRRIQLVLKDSARKLTNEDLLKIAEAAGKLQGEMLIRPGSWQVLVRATEAVYQRLSTALRSMGYPCRIRIGEIEKIPGFILRNDCDAAPV